MKILSNRVRIIIQGMPGKDHGKQAELARIAGASKQTVNHWFNGVTQSMDYDQASRIAKALGYRLDWLMNGKGMPKEERDAAEALMLGEHDSMENQIGRKIAQRLRALGKTQVWLAEQVDVSNNAVTKWIKTGQISIDKAVKVAPALEITLDELLDNEDASITQPPRDAAATQPSEARLQLIYVDGDELEMLTRLREAPDNLRTMAKMILNRFLAGGREAG
jgi:transcriptional regulator with XRE-family HTH domain